MILYVVYGENNAKIRKKSRKTVRNRKNSTGNRKKIAESTAFFAKKCVFSDENCRFLRG